MLAGCDRLKDQLRQLAAECATWKARQATSQASDNAVARN
jgi:hypothetical protein